MTTWLEHKIDSVDNPGVEVTPSRVIDTSFVPSASKYVMGMYTLELDCDEGETVTVELRSDAADPPTVVRASALLTVAVDGDSGATQKVTSRQQLCYVAQPGDHVKLVKSGTGTAAIAHQTEIAIS